MAGGSQLARPYVIIYRLWPQWSPGLMAGGRLRLAHAIAPMSAAAMEPRPDGRGKLNCPRVARASPIAPQWSPGLMAGGSRSCPV